VIMIDMEILRSSPLLGQLPASMLDKLTSAATEHSLHADALLFQHGDLADGLYILLEGRVSVFRAGPDGNDVELAIQEAGSLLGEMALLDNQPRSASIRCLDDCRFLHLPKEVFQEVMQTANDGLLAMASSLSLRLRNTDQQYHDEVLSRERLRTEAEIQRHRSLSRTVAGVAHEINTPIGIARSAADVISEIVADLLARTDMPEGVENTLADLGEAADLTTRNIVRASELIQQFKNLSIQQVSEETVTVSLVEVIEEALGLFRMEAASSKLEINFRHQLEDDGRWTGMPGLVSQVLMNLLTNVQRYAYDAEGGEIEILLERPVEAAEDKSYLLFFRDHGKGIPEEDQDQIFEPFFTTGRSQGGSGLGLAIVRTLVQDSLGGSITLTSRRGWTEFRIELPGRSDQP